MNIIKENNDTVRIAELCSGNSFLFDDDLYSVVEARGLVRRDGVTAVNLNIDELVVFTDDTNVIPVDATITYREVRR